VLLKVFRITIRTLIYKIERSRELMMDLRLLSGI